MSTLADRPTQLNDILAIKNAKMARKQLSETNFEVLSIEPYSEARQRYNTVAKIKIDTRPGSPIEGCENERFVTRRVPFTRLALRDAVKLSGLTLDSKGRLKVDSVESLEAIASFVTEKLNLEPEELTLIKTDDNNAMVRAKADSLGFTGYLLVTTEEDDTPSEDGWVKAGDDFTGSYVSTDNTGESVNNQVHLGRNNWLIVVSETLEEPTYANLAVKIGGRAQPVVKIDIMPQQLNPFKIELDEAAVFGEEYEAVLQNEDGTVKLAIGKWPIIAPV